MGSEVSSCCGGAGEKETQLDIPQSPDEYNVTKSAIGPTEFSKDEKDTFRENFYAGIDVHLILQDKSKLTCQVRLDRQHQFLLLSCDKKVRAIGMKDIKTILHTKEQLKRVESSAGITDIDACAAIHLRATGNCIPLFFLTSRDKGLFVECVNEAKAVLTKE